MINYEMRRYQIKCRLPEIENKDSLYTAALYGAEEHPEYFGAFPFYPEIKGSCVVE